MNHERFEELSALALYGELDAREREELELHLRTCAECRRQRDELQRGLGRLVRPRVEHVGALPADWDAALARAIADEPRVRSTWLPALASFAAGLLATWVVMRGATDAPARTEVSSAPASAWSRFHAEAAPPQATSAGSLGRLVSALRH